jgi:L-alanine-DL-glutamate epimerase-like enolase superfamily enzyme
VQPPPLRDGISISVAPLRIPLRLRHKQASSDRSHGDSIWIEARRGPHVGLGEGCPRDYVTGERAADSFCWLQAMAEAAGAAARDLDELRHMLREHQTAIDAHPGAWCALESALLDLFAREAGVPIERLLGLPETPSVFHYTAILSDVSLETTQKLVEFAAAAEIDTFKIKLSGDLARDRKRLSLVFDRIAGLPRVRLDANNLWGDDADAALAHLSALRYPFEAIEEPLAPRRAAATERIALGLGVPIILDESLGRPADFDLFRGHPGPWIANLKVSRCGGLLRALDMVETAKIRMWPVIVGAHVGETSVLTRLGMALARAAAGSLKAMEGAAGLLLLNHEPVRPILQMDTRGAVNLAATDCEPVGLGLRLEVTRAPVADHPPEG